MKFAKRMANAEFNLFPVHFRGQFIAYSSLKHLLHSCNAHHPRLVAVSPAGTAACDAGWPRACSCAGAFYAELLAGLASSSAFFEEQAAEACAQADALAGGWTLRRVADLFACAGGGAAAPSPTRQSVAKLAADVGRFAALNALALRKILKKFDKVHGQPQAESQSAPGPGDGAAFLAAVRESVSQYTAVLNSPTLVELAALEADLAPATPMTRASMTQSSLTKSVIPPRATPESVAEPAWPPLLADGDSAAGRLADDLGCAVCLETLHRPVAVRCGHRFCLSCARAVCLAGGQGDIRLGSRVAKCPLCRRAGAFSKGWVLHWLDLMIHHKHPAEWAARERERKAAAR